MISCCTVNMSLVLVEEKMRSHCSVLRGPSSPKGLIVAYRPYGHMYQISDFSVASYQNSPWFLVFTFYNKNILQIFFTRQIQTLELNNSFPWSCIRETHFTRGNFFLQHRNDETKTAKDEVKGAFV